MFQQNPQHTGLSPRSGAKVGSARWRFPVTIFQDGELPTFNVPSPPIVGPRGRVYLAVETPASSNQWKLSVISSAGKHLNPSAPLLPGSPVGTPALGPDNTIYVQAKGFPTLDTAALFALRPSGSPKWQLL